MSLRLKLIGTFLAIVCCLPIVGGIGLYFSKQAVKNYNQVAQIGVVGTETYSALQTATRDLIQYTIWITLPANSAKEIEEALGRIETAKTIFQNVASQSSDGDISAKEKEVFKELSEKWATLAGISSQISELVRSGEDQKKNQAYEKLRAEFNPASASFTDSLSKVSDTQSTKVDVLMATTEKQTRTGNWISLAVIVAGFIMALVVGILFSNSLAKSLNSVASHLSKEASNVFHHSGKFSENSLHVSEMTSGAASSLLQISSSFEKISAVVHQSSENAGSAAKLSKDSSISAARGEGEMSDLILAMTQISKSSHKISSIVNLIDDIAFQTNILALNAAVEAARAGEHGRGFAVVAESVRSLAQKSSDAANEIGSLITENVDRIALGVTKADKSGQALKEILKSIEQVAQINSQIASASREQEIGIQQISEAIKQIDSSTQNTASVTEQMAAAAGSMSTEAEGLTAQAELLRHIIEGRRNPRSSEKVSSGHSETEMKAA